jgi:hypothetical protein
MLAERRNEALRERLKIVVTEWFREGVSDWNKEQTKDECLSGQLSPETKYWLNEHGF